MKKIFRLENVNNGTIHLKSDKLDLKFSTPDGDGTAIEETMNQLKNGGNIFIVVNFDECPHCGKAINLGKFERE